MWLVIRSLSLGSPRSVFPFTDTRRRDSSSALPCNDETCKFEAPVKHGASSDNQVAWRSFRSNTSRLLFMNLGITILLTIVFALSISFVDSMKSILVFGRLIENS